MECANVGTLGDRRNHSENPGSVPEMGRYHHDKENSYSFQRKVSSLIKVQYPSITQNLLLFVVSLIIQEDN